MSSKALSLSINHGFTIKLEKGKRGKMILCLVFLKRQNESSPKKQRNTTSHNSRIFSTIFRLWNPLITSYTDSTWCNTDCVYFVIWIELFLSIPIFQGLHQLTPLLCDDHAFERIYSWLSTPDREVLSFTYYLSCWF